MRLRHSIPPVQRIVGVGAGCRDSVAENWWFKPEVFWLRLPVAAGLFIFLYFRF